ncbi:MAG: hypothetical protein QM638_05475, partial [Nocardioides sp.]|uniref:hypothetical protein n=1 Tax=Nocardioides sp. TaxID=35761 RepID=UPI0039E2EDC5
MSDRTLRPFRSGRGVATTESPSGSVAARGVGRRGLLVAAAGLGAAGLVGWSPVIESKAAGAFAADDTLTVASGDTVTLTETTELSQLVIEDGGTLAVPDGYSLSLTVNGVETGSTLEDLYTDDGIATYIAAGTYSGSVVLDVATANDVTYNSRTWPLRQAVYVDADGIDTDRSVLSAVQGGVLRDSVARGVKLRSTGEAFNGIYVAGGDYRIANAKIAYHGNGRLDFIGYGSAVYATGTDTTMRVENTKIHNKGVVRTAVIADGGSQLVVKNSDLSCKDGVLPDDYENTGDTSFMMTCPWLLGMYGTVRTTNLLGDSTRATYLGTTVTVDNWGCLSVDSGTDCILVSIDSTLESVKTDGYGSYGIGDVTEHFLGTRMNVGSYIMINFGAAGTHYGDSTKKAVRELNNTYDLGLTKDDINSVLSRACYLRSRKFGFMWQDVGPVTIDGRTALRTAQTAFLSKAAQSSITVDGSDGASIKSGTGVIYQLMDNDNPGSTTATDKPWSREYTVDYVEPTDAATKSDSWDTTTADSDDATGDFTAIKLNGDFYNSVLGGGNGDIEGQNLVLSFTDCEVNGIISASTAKHNASTINFSNYEELGVVTNTPAEVVNNGVIVTLAGSSVWTVSGTSYLSSLT